MLGLLLLQVVGASATTSPWEQTVEANADAIRDVIAVASSMKGGWGDSATATVSYAAYSINNLVEPQSEAYIPLLMDVPSGEANSAIMDWASANWPAVEGTVSTKQELKWTAVMLGSEGKTLLSKTDTINEIEKNGKKSTTVSSYLSLWHFDDDNKVYKVTDFFPMLPSKFGAGSAAENLVASAQSLSNAPAFFAGVLTSAALAAAMFVGVSWKKRALPTALQSPLMAHS